MTVHLSVWVWPAAFAIWVLGALLGFWAGLGMGQDRGYAEAEEDMARERAMARRIHPVYRQRPPEVAHEWEPAGQLIDPPLIVQEDPESLAYWRSLGGDPITTGEIQAITPRMDAFLEELFRVPYSADELWSGQ